MDPNRKVPLISITPSSTSSSRKREFMGIGFWNSYIRTPEYLNREPEKRPITAEELAKHKTENDMWIGLRNGTSVEVFDVTPFAKYHPGGAEILAQYAGTDATEAFRCAHAYISPYMIHRLKKGHLVSSSCQRNSPNTLSPSMNIMPVQLPPFKEQPATRPRWDWITSPDECLVTFEIALRRPLVSLRPSSHLIATAKSDESDYRRIILQIFIMLDKEYYFLKFRLLPQLKPDLHSMRFDRQFSYFSVDPHMYLDLKSSEQPSGLQFSTLGSVLHDELLSFSDAFERVGLMECEVVSSERLDGSPYRLLRLKWLVGQAHLPIPLLHHVLLCVKDSNGLVHMRPYTPTCVNLSPEEGKMSDPTKFDILVKVYPNGSVSSLLDNAVKGSVVKVSLPRCQLGASVLLSRCGDLFRPWPSVCMLCGGSGITPFLPLIQYLLALHESRLYLLWFNRREEDLILRSQLDDLAASSGDQLQVHYWLVEPEERIKTCKQLNVTIGGIEGITSPESFGTFLNTSATSLLCLICGPQGFNSAASALAQVWGIPSSNVHILQ
ncbi:Cytochrome b5 reductase 4 [Echinococcus granulosus]|nr:Cytochrome b5 reductase 4 [Echinococcus granulosus]